MTTAYNNYKEVKFLSSFCVEHEALNVTRNKSCSGFQHP